MHLTEMFIGSNHSSYIQQSNDQQTGSISLSLRWQLPVPQTRGDNKTFGESSFALGHVLC